MKAKLLMGITCLLLTACAGDVESEFYNGRAFCRITPVTAATPLYEALNNPGMFCTLTPSTGKYIFTRQNGTSVPLNITAVEQNYGQLRSINNMGFIIGTHSLPDFKGNFYQTVYDIVCPNCYEVAITRSLSLSNEEAICYRCGRHYSLINKGRPDEGRKLFRYHMIYAPATDTFIISN